MLNVVACVDQVVSFCGAEVRVDAASITSTILRDLEHPHRSLQDNTINSLHTLARRALDATCNALTNDLALHSGIDPIDGEDTSTYVARAVTTLRVRTWRRAAALDAARSCMDVVDRQDALERGELHGHLRAVWQDGGVSVRVDTVVENLKKRGIDGEQLCWAVITRESLNHILLVRKEAYRAARSWSDRSAEDLIGYGWRGLRLALRSYNPDEAWFSTYACPKIRGSIRDGVRNEHHLPKRLNTFVNKVERAKDDLISALGRHPSAQEIAEQLDIDVERVHATTTYAAPAPLETEDGYTVSIDNGASVEDLTIAADTSMAVHTALSQLPDDEATAVRLLVMEQIPMREVREHTGASPKQLRARRDRGLAALREALAELESGEEGLI